MGAEPPGLDWSDSLDGMDWQALSELYRVAPLGDKPPDRLKTAFGNSRYVCVVREGGRLVGAGRMLADGVDCAYLCDVAVHPDLQGRGVGRGIVQRLVEAARGHRKIILYAVPGKEDFYRSFGFLGMRTAMAIFPDPGLAVAQGYLQDAAAAGQAAEDAS